MPLYEYECETCHYHFEVRQKFTDPPIQTCRQCGEGVRKLISAPGLMFKGTGWYVTDYSNKLKDPAASQSGEGAPKSDAGRGDQAGPAKSETGSTAGSSSSTVVPSGSTPSSAAAKSDPGKPARS
ncbi:MAG: transcriptional regulator [Nitrospira sp.]|nr:transcriptional regulator [Nitrospira sp.]